MHFYFYRVSRQLLSLNSVIFFIKTLFFYLFHDFLTLKFPDPKEQMPVKPGDNSFAANSSILSRLSARTNLFSSSKLRVVVQLLDDDETLHSEFKVRLIFFANYFF